jgi:hypothetical protein
MTKREGERMKDRYTPGDWTERDIVTEGHKNRQTKTNKHNKSERQLKVKDRIKYH